jgi:diguanylate cyclase (GGDEF)-like protein
MTTETRSDARRSQRQPAREWIASVDSSESNTAGSDGWLRRLSGWLLLNDAGDDPRRWKLSAYRIIVASSLLLCLLVAAHSLATAWALGIVSVIATVCAYYVALILALHTGERSPTLAGSLLLGMIYVCGLLILLGVGDYALSDLGVIFLYVTPVIAWIYFGPRRALLLMAANAIPFIYMVLPERPLSPLGIDMLMPHSHLYLHALLFLFFNISIPLALFRVVSALDASAHRNDKVSRHLQQSTQLYEEMFEHAGGATLICDRDGRILRANEKARALLGQTDQLPEAQMTLGDLIVPTTLGVQLDALLRVAANAGFAEEEFIVRQDEGVDREVLLSIKSLGPRCLLASFRDMSTLRAMERDLRAIRAARDHLIAHDQLTNLPNREALLAQLQRLMGDSTSTTQGKLLAVASLRLNNIRSINEKYGQKRGDELIREFAATLALHQRDGFQIFRLRGVVFLILIGGCTTPEQLRLVIERFIDKLPAQYRWSDQAIDLDISVGAAFTRGKEISASDLIHRSERALEIARKQAKEPLVLFNEDSAREIHREIDISLALSGAIARREFSVVYQPKVDAEKQIQGLEALVRWYSPELGNVSPAEFVPIAEHIGKIHLITDFVIESVCRQLADWHARFGSVRPVAINLSGLDLQRDELVNVIQKVLQRHRIDPAWLQLEITETGLIENDLIARRNIDRLIAAGLSIAIDDFGTGYSSLKKLSEYPIHTIKIDRSFVSAIGKNRRSDRIIQLILTLAKVLNCEVVAEGVETRRQLQFLLENGCKRFQGYLFHRPMPHNDIDNLLRRDA